MKLAVSICLLTASAFAATPPPASASPDTVKPGDTFKYTVVIPETPCSTAYFAGTTASQNIQISGSGVALTTDAPTVTGCSLVVTMRADPNASYGDHLVTIYNTPDANTPKYVIGTFHLYVTSTTAGPIPPGISPQVDVMWNILSENSCSDQFGLRIARRYYCVEVVLGNNSGFPLIISGVGFLHQVPGFQYKEANVSYLNLRATATREQTISGRNITLRALQAAGVTVAGFAPFARNTIPHLHITIWATVLGTVLAGAWDGLVPDRTIVQSHNLDDAALRDGKLIPNNSPVRFTIFVERDSVKALLLPLADRLKYRATMYRKMADDIKSSSDADAAVKDKNADALKGIAAALDEQAGKYSLPEVAKAGAKHSPIGRRTTDAEGDLMQVRRALGSLVLVGDQIEYKQRIQVDSSAVNPEIVARPAIEGVPSINPPLTAGKAQTHTIVVQGMNFANVQVTAALQAPGAAASTPIPLSGTPQADNIHVSAQVALTAAQEVAGAVLSITIRTNGGSVSYSFPPVPAPPPANE